MSDHSSLNSTGENTNSEEQSLHTFVKQMLQTRLFLGDFQERRYVESLNAYRDVVVVASSEGELKSDLDVVKQRLHDFYLDDMWLGVTEPGVVGAPTGYCIWTELPNIALGKYWFQIKSIKYRHNEVLLRLKCVRSYTSQDIIRSSQTRTSTESTVANPEPDSTTSEPDWDTYFTDVKKATNENIYWFFATVLTLQNSIEVVKFISVLSVTLLTGGISVIKFVGDFSLKFMREVAIFVQAATPMFLGLLDLISKIVGGFYILIAMMWRGNSTPIRNTMVPPIQYQPIDNRRNQRHFS